MASSHQIKCVVRADKTHVHERISAIGGTNPDGGRWKVSVERAILGIEEEKWKFWILVGAQRVDVYVFIDKKHRKYLKPASDDELSNSLLNLPDCP